MSHKAEEDPQVLKEPVQAQDVEFELLPGGLVRASQFPLWRNLAMPGRVSPDLRSTAAGPTFRFLDLDNPIRKPDRLWKTDPPATYRAD